MATNPYAAGIYVTPAAGTTITTATETALQAAFNFPASYWTVGKNLLIRARGVVSAAAASQGNITFNARWGSATAGTILAGTTATALTAAAANVLWKMELDLICRSVGTAGTIIAIGDMQGANGLVTALSTMANASPPTAVAIDTTTASAFNVTALLSLATAGNSVTCHQLSITELN